jgi:hypothetical protein
MRALLIVLLIALFCSTSYAAESGQLIVSVDQKPRFTLELPEGWTSEFDGKKMRTVINQAKFEAQINLWRVPKLKTAAAAKPLIDDMIKDEIVKFKITGTKEFGMHGDKAILVMGSGARADDGAPANVEVILFSFDGTVCLLCTHGAGKGATLARGTLVSMLATARRL